MDPATILTIMSILETLTKTSINIYASLQQLKNIDPNSVNLKDIEELQEALDKAIELRMQIREQMIEELEKRKSS